MNNFESNPLKRFSDRVENYIKYRPKYPQALIDFLINDLKLIPENIGADIGSGTGIFSEMLLRNGNKVFGVEPNKEMREAAEKLLNGYPNFISINGTSESTNLEFQSIDLITAAQSFHWFDYPKTKEEFLRILKPNGWVVLIWNSRINDSSSFMNEYENFLLKFSVDYSKISHKNIDDKIFRNFFNTYESKNFSNSQSFDFEGLKGRLLSSSYIPNENNPNFYLMINELEKIFNRNENSGKVGFIYNTEIHYGHLG